MSVINVMPDVLVHKFYKSGAMTGVSPASVTYAFNYDNEAVANFTLGETISWGSGGTAGEGTLVSLTDEGTTGSMIIVPTSGVAPTDGLELTGGSSTATCDVDGNVVSGSSLVDSGESIYRGRYRHISGLTDGGLVEFQTSIGKNGFRVNHVTVNLPGMTAVSFGIVDLYGMVLGAQSITLTSGIGYCEWTHLGLFVPPGCKFKAAGTGTLTDSGEIMFTLGHGWRDCTFDADFLGLGNMYLPPSR